MAAALNYAGYRRLEDQLTTAAEIPDVNFRR